MKVKFLPMDVEIEIPPNKSVLHLAHENNIHIKSVCKGIPSCAECVVKLVDGEYNVLPPSNTEKNLIGTAYFVNGRRLSCQLRCFGDITVDLSEQIEKAQRNLTTKRPRGGKGKEGPSNAILGNIMSAEDSMEKDSQEFYERELQEQQLRELKRKKDQANDED